MHTNTLNVDESFGKSRWNKALKVKGSICEMEKFNLRIVRKSCDGQESMKYF